MKHQRLEIDIAPLAIVKVVLTLLVFLFLWRVIDVFILFFFAIVLAAAIAPIVDKWSRVMPRSLAAALIFLLAVGLFILSFSLLLPPLLFQAKQLSDQLPELFSGLSLRLNSLPADSQFGEAIRESLNSLPGQLQGVIGQIPGLISAFLSGFYSLILVAFITFYLLMEEKGIKKAFLQLIPGAQKPQTVEVLSKIGQKIGDWLRGQLILMLLIGLVDWLGLSVIGIPYALTLGLWAGLTEVVPFVGPFLGAVPAVIIALTLPNSLMAAVFVIVLYTLVQQLESNVIVPRVMAKAVGLSPLAVILALVIGGKLLGLPGIIVAVPIAAAISVVIDDWAQIRQSFISKQPLSDQ